jgi:hypothetical protein
MLTALYGQQMFMKLLKEAILSTSSKFGVLELDSPDVLTVVNLEPVFTAHQPELDACKPSIFLVPIGIRKWLLLLTMERKPSAIPAARVSKECM